MYVDAQILLWQKTILRSRCCEMPLILMIIRIDRQDHLISLLRYLFNVYTNRQDCLISCQDVFLMIIIRMERIVWFVWFSSLASTIHAVDLQVFGVQHCSLWSCGTWWRTGAWPSRRTMASSLPWPPQAPAWWLQWAMTSTWSCGNEPSHRRPRSLWTVTVVDERAPFAAPVPIRRAGAGDDSR